VDSIVITIIILAIVVGVVAIAFRQRIRAIIKGPGGTELKIDASNPEPRPGVQGKNITSRRGGFTAADETGRGTDVDTVDAYQDVKLTSRPPQESSTPPK
jgi:hypothetical protein